MHRWKKDTRVSNAKIEKHELKWMAKEEGGKKKKTTTSYHKETNNEFEVEQLNSSIYQAFTVYINFVCITIIGTVISHSFQRQTKRTEKGFFLWARICLCTYYIATQSYVK